MNKVQSGVICATVVCDSVSEQGVRLTTFEIEVPRIVWSEFLTHRQFSRNAASSRAIPFAKMQEQLKGTPVSFGKNQSGMQAGEEHTALINDMYTAEEWWNLSKLSAINFSRGFADAGFHKQVFNRPTEPYQIIKAVVSATEFDNFFHLRDDEAADPTIACLARCMREAQEQSVPQLLKAGEWHLPYVFCDYFGYKEDEVDQHYYLSEDSHISDGISLENAIKVSCARCAAVSYRGEDYGLEKCLQLYERLVGSDKKHASALEHVGTPMQNSYTVVNEDDAGGDYINDPTNPETWEAGMSHMDKAGKLWSGNLRGWRQHRKLIPNECYNG